jgi:hypothetical protein
MNRFEAVKRYHESGLKPTISYTNKYFGMAPIEESWNQSGV